MTPSRMGRITWIAPGVRPSISRASFPTATIVLSRWATATTAGSAMTIPLPLTYTRTLAVPRSTPIRFPNKLYPLDRRPKAPQLGPDPFVAAVHVVHVGHFGAAAGGQAGQDQRRPRPHVQCPDAGTDERTWPANDSSGGAGRHYLCAHLAQLANVKQAVVEHPLVHVAHADSLGEEDGHRRLEVGGKPWVGQRLDGDCPQLSLPPDPERVLVFLHPPPGLPHLGDEREQVA